MNQTSHLFGLDLSPHYGLIQVSGPDRETFLQGQLTCDIHELKLSSHNLGALCNRKGRIQALFRIFKAEHAIYLQLPVLCLAPTLSILKKFARFSKVTLEDITDTWQRFGIWMPKPKNNLSEYTADPVLDQLGPLFKNADLLSLKNKEVITSNNITLLSLSDIYPRFEILGLKQDLQPIWNSLGVTTCIKDLDAWKLLDIQAMTPEVWLETLEQFLPHDINLPALGAVSFSKGCYCGQEIVARMEYRANIKRKMFHIDLTNTSTPPLPGSKLALPNDSTQIGTVITAALIEENTVAVLLIGTSSPP